ncbi:MAG: 30S ribosomal protein S21 [Patescibacteria group bacterium]|nr:30S ribosomal protein S21 [Patescibacteria group bacterium]MDE2116625.1 30S ribosomal protein S21 [Patescibacteria group bacterium]
MTTNVEVTRNGTENPLGVLRRFTKRVQGAGILPRVRGIRYHDRTLSHYKRKMHTLEAIRRREERVELIKQGKINPDIPRGRR